MENLEKQLSEKKQKMETLYETIKLLRDAYPPTEEKLSKTLPTKKSLPESLTNKYSDMSLRESIFDILKSQNEAYLNGQEVYDELIKNGFSSNSQDIKRDVHQLLYKLRKADKLVIDGNKYPKRYTIRTNFKEMRTVN